VYIILILLLITSSFIMTDRCINSNGILRYRTSRGWVSELTRGHGPRENIIEVLNVRSTNDGEVPPPPLVDAEAMAESKRTECGVPDLRSVSASVLARLHGSQTDLFAALERLMVSGIRPPTTRSSITSQTTVVGAHVIAAVKLLSSNLNANLVYAGSNDIKADDKMDEGGDDEEMSFAKDTAKCMYLGNQLNLSSASMFEEKRDRRTW